MSCVCPDRRTFSPLVQPHGSHFVCRSSLGTASKATSALNAEKSPAVPFLPYPQNLKGYIGDDIAFDPLRISDYFPMDYLRESELKYVLVVDVVAFSNQ